MPTPPLPYPVWTRVRNTRTQETGIVRRTETDQAGGWWLHVELPRGLVWWLADLCEAQ